MSYSNATQCTAIDDGIEPESEPPSTSIYESERNFERERERGIKKSLKLMDTRTTMIF
jgi:hypothetical protein